MLQIPSGALSMFAFSYSSQRLVGLLYIGAQFVALVLSSFKTEMIIPTRTLTIVDKPTKCFLSNRTTSFPYVAAMVHAAIVTSGLCYILHAKGFFVSTTPPTLPFNAKTLHDKSFLNPNPPPTPPPDADTENNARKRRARWPWILLLSLAWIVVVSLSAALFVAYSAPLRSVLHPFHVFAGDNFIWIEKALSPVRISVLCLKIRSWPTSSISFVTRHFFRYWCHLRTLVASGISLFAPHFSQHGRQYLRILLVASGHCASIFIGRALRRGCIHIGYHPHHYYRWATWSQSGFAVYVGGDLSALEKAWLNLVTNVLVFIPLPAAVVVIIFLASSWLREFIWMVHYTGYRAGVLPSFPQIQQALTWILGPLYPVDYAILLGPTFIHLGLLFLLAVYRLPFRIIKNDIGAIWGCISDPHEFLIRALRATGCALKKLLVAGFILASLCFATQLCLLTADTRRLLSFAFSCSESRRTLWGLAGYQLKRYGVWKSIQIYSIPNPTGFMNACCEAWAAMSLTQRLIIIAPTIIFFLWIDFIRPASRKSSLEREIQNSRRPCTTRLKIGWRPAR
ncbi:hypothetical protein C8F04DRAFT_1149984 [Mycena alexandri]|uniref:Uncharacterized protein n=1 Tax=Mycena alexandri TaxID=1745969 RepID=A0AAD6WS08_9AGAR|nr:hypothetical protein C8F04DRAFT_1149984 [Mycena alexandri]